MGALFSSEEDDLRRRSVTRSPSMDTSTSHDLAEPPVGTNRKADLADILLLLMNINESKIQIPLMLVVDILNYAGALPSVEATNATPFRSGGNCDLCYLAMPLPRSPYITPISMHIVVESKDQGWSSYPQEKGTRTSHTWGELGLSCAPTVRYPVFRNIHAGASFETQEFDYALSSAGTGAEVNETIVPLINAMRAGISATSHQASLHLIVRSMYPGWAINMKYACITMHYQLCGDWDAFVQRYSKPQRQARLAGLDVSLSSSAL